MSKYTELPPHKVGGTIVITSTQLKTNLREVIARVVYGRATVKVSIGNSERSLLIRRGP